ncbi:hypothetical protein L1987_54874 [Smallanthus sonchifolius]|uniref:Uncharacterized protein n=1 Tax=Smallanthus sonchifolius TaxID=185202 RepID=A0ACB9E9F1_9ASTR|nr:hypothetical protein L1987_54874 [Smallanthus sonchifolius]
MGGKHIKRNWESSEVREVLQRKLPAISGKVLDPEFKELEDEEKGMEAAIGSEDSEMKENDDSIQKQENDTPKKDSELKENDDSIQKQENDTTEKGKKRSSPAQFFKCIGILRGNQIEGVKRMGFGRLLKLKMDGISAKIGHFVVDSFCPKKMQIIVQKHKIKIDCQAIQQLLGVPCGEVTIESMSKLKTRDDSVIEWRNRYPINFVAPTELASNIENAEDEDCFNFRMDFLMCFLAVMLECHGQQRCKENILDKLTSETNFSNINWCAYIIDSMRGCKKRWKRNDRGVPFSGSLAILTLLYVDSVECKGIKMEKKMNPISFWNMSRLKERQKWEIENGGFGKGKYKRLTKLIEDEEDSGYSVVDEIEGLEKLLDVLHKQKKLIDNKLGRLLEKHPEREEVLVIKAKYDSLMQTTERNAEIQAEAADRMTNDKIESVLEDLANCSGTNSQSGDDEKTYTEQNSEDNATMINEEEKGVGELHESDTISLGQGDLEEGHNLQDTDKNLEITEEMSDEEQGRHRITEQENTTENVYDGPHLQSKDCDNETSVEQTEERSLKKMVDGKESSVSEAVTKEEELVWEYLFKEDGMIKGKGKVGTDDESEIVYRNNYNLEIEKFRFKTLKEDTNVFNKVIDAWGDVLNFEEKYRSPTSPYRLFCDTDLINDHYYLIVFELKHPCISVIDNFSDAYPLVRLSDHEDYFEKDSAYKVKEIFVKYLEHVKHPKTDELNAAKIKKVKIAWATTSNALDCVVFVMRHMEKYMGAKVEFNTGLSSNGPKKNKQLKILRKKYAAHILLSECNQLRQQIQIEALGK